MASAQFVIGVDWGSSNRRAYLVNQHGEEQARREDAAGVLSTGSGDYYRSLVEFIGDWQQQTGAAIWLSGMIGSRSGWHEAPYLEAPVNVAKIAQHALAVATANSSIPTRILPGVCQRPPIGAPDVMRGEETQLLGAWQLCRADGWYVLPGTHSKWVYVEQGNILHFHTFMTGELFAGLRAGGALAPIANMAPDNEQGFLHGLAQARDSSLLAALFGIRAGALLATYPAPEASSRLSGLLIGAEWQAALKLGALATQRIHFIGSPSLVRWYELAAHTYGVEAKVLSPDACYHQALAHCLQETS